MKYRLSVHINHTDGTESTPSDEEFTKEELGNLEDEIIGYIDDPLVSSVVFTIVKTNPES